MLRITGLGLLALPLLWATVSGLYQDAVLGLLPLALLLPVCWIGRRVEYNPNWVSPFVLGAACVGGTLALWSSAQIPVSVDGEVYLFQARLFAAGRLSADTLGASEFFHYYFLVPGTQGELYGVFPPGWPLLLALGALLGSPWIVNPLLTVLLVVLTARLARQVFPKQGHTEILAAWLMALSPFVVGQGGAMMSHPLAACLTVGAILAAYQLEAARWRPALLVGVCVGLLFIVRPLNGLFVGCVLLALHGFRAGWRPVAVSVLLAALLGSTYLWVNQQVTGDALTPGQDAYFARTEPNSGCHRLGFGPTIGCVNAHQLERPGYTLIDALETTGERLTVLGRKGFGPGFALLLPLLLAWGGTGRRSGTLWAILGIQVLVYAAFYYHGNFLGPRLLFEAFPMLAVLVAAGAWTFRWAGVAIALGGLIGGHVLLQVDAESYRWMPYEEVSSLVAEAEGDQKIIFVDSEALRDRARWTHYSLGMVLGDIPGPDAARLFAHDLGNEPNQRLLRRLPHHRAYRLRLDPIGDLDNPFQADLEPSLVSFSRGTSVDSVIALAARFPSSTQTNCGYMEPRTVSPGNHVLHVQAEDETCVLPLVDLPEGSGPWRVNLSALSSAHGGRWQLYAGEQPVGMPFVLSGRPGQLRRLSIGLLGANAVGPISIRGVGQGSLVTLRFHPVSPGGRR